MIRRFVFLLVLILAACNAEPTPTDSVFVTATSNLNFVPPAQEENIAGTDIPSEFSGGNPQIVSNQSPFSFSVRGDIEADVSTGSIVYNFIPATDYLSARDQLYIASSTALSSQQVTFQFNVGITEGEYSVSSTQTLTLGLVNAQYGYLSDDGVLQLYSEDVFGNFIVTAVGDTLSAEFEFTAQYTDRDGNVHQVEVSGNFSDVRYNRSGDPFDIAVPLPTRGITGTDEP